MQGDCDQPGSDVPPRPDYAREAALARGLLRQRRKRETMIGKEHFADPAWDMMLDLFAARVVGEQVAASSLFVAANVPQSTALRRIRHLVDDGLFVASLDPHDGRRTFVRLSDALFERVGAFLHQWLASSDEHPPTG